MKICNPNAILLLALLSTLSVEASSVPKYSHAPPIERTGNELHSRETIKEAFTGLTWKHYGAGAAGGALSSAILFSIVMGGMLHNLPKGPFAHDDAQSGTSPTNGRRSAVTATMAEDTHRNSVRREADGHINSANASDRTRGRLSQEDWHLYYIQKRSLEYATTAKVLGQVAAASGQTGVIALNRRWSSAPVLGAVDSKHFDNEDAIKVVLRSHLDAEPEKNANALATRTMSPQAMFALCFMVGLPVGAILGGTTSAIIKAERHTQHHKRDVDLKYLRLVL
ncbi:unnamed protein product [Tilletia controversa]|uniref:Uncharacterized protein n=2 Tax=Tilletia TaxID=13289 RepID=A0A8X7MNA2_9BASI|nr:hypothetical protein A4X06_0g6653 [Tilletia controversa]KAE8252016.1 hypothetical protein A4X03_0g6268 [Tilletia caries]CAD6924598.1 unnamed protein product [Tilletia caries]CAD6933249.1 unnamed protein product [Tilletia controversa]CAD6966677.1 unnamed protein product [Tilletia laevis]